MSDFIEIRRCLLSLIYSGKFKARKEQMKQRSTCYIKMIN